jgi:hypothetical protein
MGIFDFFKGKNNPFDLDKLLQLDDPTSALVKLDTYLNERSAYGEDLSGLSDAQKTVLFVENLEREANNGGFHQFYWNTSGDYAHETLAGLITIGALHMAAILQQANAAWPHGEVPTNSITRRHLQETIGPQAEAVWEQCDQQFYAYPDDIASLLWAYVKQHRSAFE